MTKAEDHVRQSMLLAPIDGTVQQLSTHTIGGVVTPAEALLSIVPDHDTLLVEATVQNKDVGFVRAGQSTRVKVDAFNFTRYGLVEGTVLSVTKDALRPTPIAGDGKFDAEKSETENSDINMSQEAAPAYIAYIMMHSTFLMTEEGRTPLAPGMQVVAEIQTGRRRIISYLLSPLIRHVDESFKER